MGDNLAEAPPAAGDDEGFSDDENVTEEAMDIVPNTNPEAEVDEVLNGPKATVYYAIQTAEPDDQGKDYTKDEVEDMMRSEAYQRKISTCHLCHKSWYDGQRTEDCKECGGFTLTRSCPICLGKCETVWNRNVKMSHAMHEAHWDGTCGLTLEEQRTYALHTLTDSSEDFLSEGLQDLSTS
ncbi:uncharacterized protein LOC121376806 [Gigantopelta aegis]|uniref:uncharacterized protein LOC121376806 n=1 Tax=Gigantopelta aegis TaxID=1735272 RepID=UPI001B88792C|nr:uncharacterized protein LOC121376806 [Gigantopelta aegis]